MQVGTVPPVDTLCHFETPEGVILNLRLAGPVARSLAWLVDALIRYSVLFALVLVFSLLEQIGVGLILLLFFSLEWFYPVIFEALLGATPGKRMFGLSVVQEDGTPVSWANALVRNLLRAVDFLPGCYGFGLLSMLLHPQFKRLGDIAAGTLVIYAAKQAERPNVPQAEPLLPNFPLSLEEQRALLDFAERSAELSQARQEELAQLVCQLPADEARQQLLRYANGLMRSA